MGDQRNYAALDWVLGEIEETLNDARQALEAYVENPKDTTQLRFCVTHIHQVRGSLQIVEFHGASLLAEEMEALAQGIMDQSVSNVSDAQEVLMRSLLQLPIYLDHVKVYRDDTARSILPLLNDIRAVRKQAYLSETNLFSPDLSALEELGGAKHPVLNDPAKLRQVTGKLREMYQFAAASVLRNIKVGENLAYIEKVFERLTVLTSGTRAGPLWTIALALIEGLKNEDIEMSVAVQGLLRHLARELRVLAEKAPESFHAAPREGLIKNLLYYVARSEAKTPRIQAVKSRYLVKQGELSDGEENVEGYNVSALDPEAVRSVVLALREELKSIKSNLDTVLTSQLSPSELREVLPVVKRVADTLAVLGIGELRRKMLMQAEALEELSQRNSLDEATLVHSASDIIDVDTKLEAISKAVDRHRDLSNINERSIEIDEAKLAVIRECQVGLEKAKEAIIDYISSQWDVERLENIDQLLHDIRGGLDMVPLPRAGRIIDQCSQFIVDKLSNDGVEPSWHTLEKLADAMASVEYFLERISNDMSEDADSLLDVAEESLTELGFDAPERASEPEAEQRAEPEPAPQLEVVEAAPPVAEVVVEPTEPETPFVEPVEAEPESIAPFEAAPAEELSEPDSLQTEALVDETPSSSDEFDAPPIAAPEPEAVEEESDIDDEIVEVFIEEAAEVLETLEEHVPQWIDQPDNQEALTVVRRAFHTLKGSGRMVEAMEVGELAWSIENMLNRVIDQSVSYQAQHGQIVNAVCGILPDMVEAFRTRKPNPRAAEAEDFSRWAFTLAEGVVPHDFNIDTQQAVAEEPAPAAEFEPELDDSDDEDDQALLEIFCSEVETHLSTIREFIAWMEAEAPLYLPPTDDLQRALHTLKGSARMAQVTPIARMYEVLESFAKEMVTFQVPINEDILQLMRDAVAYTLTSLEQIGRREPVQIDKLDQFLARTAELRELAVGHLVRMKELERDGEKPVDPRLLSIFMAEEMSLLLDADQILDCWCRDPSSEPRVPELSSELKTLAVGAAQAKLPDMETVSLLLVDIYDALLASPQHINSDAHAQLKRGHDALLDMVDAVAAGQNVQAPPASLIDDLRAYLAQVEDSTPSADTLPEGMPALTDVYVDDSVDTLQTEAEMQTPADSYAPEAGSEHMLLDDAPEDVAPVDETPVDAAPVDEMPSWDTPPSAFESTPEPVFQSEDLPSDEMQPAQDAFVQPEQSAFADEPHELNEHVDVSFEEPSIELEAQLEDSTVDALVGDSEEQGPSDEWHAEPSTLEAEAPEETSSEDESFDLEATEDSQEDTPQETSAAAVGGALDIIDMDSDDFDADILEVFLEESDELFEEMDEAIHNWESEGDVRALEEMKRALHTMKGGARLSGLQRLGDLVHDYESYLIALNPAEVDANVFAQVHQFQDKSVRAVNAVKAQLGGAAVVLDDSPTPDIPASDVVDKAEVEDTPSMAPPSGDSSGGNVVPFVGKPKTPAPMDSMPDTGGGAAVAVAAKKAGPQEVVRVNSELLEELVNLAGETSISRARLEEQVSEFRMSLDEVDATISRLQEQLRRLDIETEAQILFRQEQMAVHEESFDPLEMDRYSQLQQLSRSLMESASDLYDLRSDLSNKVKDAETTLLQQSRINTNLQEGLMRSRMVPFSRLVPRLRRIVRQVASELGKKVSFELDNIEGELDRNVLERMVPPFEHMLRNAVDHGIESPEDRVASGKPESGRIVLTLGREGSNVTIRLADDGRGIDLQRVRKKAIERGLMDADAELSDHDIMQFILHAGFSTAESVTQISGRGVGMDVVNAEIKQLGGDVTINSEWGRGTEFIIQLPFTLSVNRALMVAIGQDPYAIPLNAIEGIVRISPFELEHYYDNPDSDFEYAGDRFKVRYLGGLLYPGRKAILEGHALPLPIVLVRTAQHKMALQVDALMGSREIVVKSLGAQFSTVQGLSGATVMGDGSVVVILDPHALVRQEIAKADLLLDAAKRAQLELHGEEQEAQEPQRVRTVMVVDDSVTVRKVTTRFLEREGYNVITAKDGVDALRVLQDDIPDLMLLDIEMPRMDGFEVAKNIRTTQRWKHLPIIMITSRTGAKHRDHAKSLGVDRYMGKPYQEDALIETIQELIGEDAGASGR